MRQFGLAVAFSLLALVGAQRAAPAAQPARLLVAYREATSASVLEQRLHLAPIARIDELRIDVLAADRAREPVILAALRGSRTVRWAEPDHAVQAFRTPNDPFWLSQWSPRKTRAPAAWDRTVGGAGAMIAVVDTGIDARAPDLRGRIVPGFDFVNGDSDPGDDNGHGTAVAGVIAAAGDNAVGVAGYCWRCRLLALKVLGPDGTGLSSDLALGMVWAVDHGARVINASLGGPVDDLAVAAAAEYAGAHGVLVVAAAGNDSASAPSYPAALPSIVSVAASSPADELYAFSNRGAALAAPGENSTTSLGGGYESFLGTSSAAPVVSGIAGLLLGLVPAATPAQLTEALEQSAVPVTGVTFGRVDSRSALDLLLAPAHAQPSRPAGAAPRTTRTFAGSLGRHGKSFGIVTGAGPLQIRFEVGGKGSPLVAVAVRREGQRVASDRGRRVVRLSVKVRAGRCRIVLTGPAGRRFRLRLTYPSPL